MLRGPAEGLEGGRRVTRYERFLCTGRFLERNFHPCELSSIIGGRKVGKCDQVAGFQLAKRLGTSVAVRKCDRHRIFLPITGRDAVRNSMFITQWPSSESCFSRMVPSAEWRAPGPASSFLPFGSCWQDRRMPKESIAMRTRTASVICANARLISIPSARSRSFLWRLFLIATESIEDVWISLYGFIVGCVHTHST